MRVLVTGSSGRIGHAVCTGLTARGHEAIGLDVRPGALTSVLCDVRLVHDTDLPQIDAIVHTASLHAPHVGTVSDATFRTVNVDGTRSLLQWAIDRHVATFVYTSTTSVYGAAMEQAGRAAWVTEDLEPSARDIYDETKLAAEQLCAQSVISGTAAAGKGGLTRCIALRMSRCFPEDEQQMAVYRLHRGVDARDVALAHALAVEQHSPAGFSVYNISAKAPFLREDCEALWEDAGAVIDRRLPWARRVFSERRWQFPDRIDRVYVIDKAEAELGFKPAVNFAQLMAAKTSQ